MVLWVEMLPRPQLYLVSRLAQRLQWKLHCIRSLIRERVKILDSNRLTFVKLFPKYMSKEI